jgi:signal transduction histidine kinase
MNRVGPRWFVLRRSAWIIAWSVAALGQAEALRAAERQKEVLVLYGARRDSQITIAGERELPARLSASIPQGIDYYAEYLDVPRFPQSAYRDAFSEFLRRKYDGHHFDAVVAVGDLAIQFLAAYRGQLFAESPIVFHSYLRSSYRLANATGIISKLNFGKALELAMALQTDLRHVFVVSGASPMDRKVERDAREEFRQFERRIDFTYLSGLATPDLHERLRTLPARSAVYFVMVNEDGAGQQVQTTDYLRDVAALANAPTYSWAATDAQAGIVGGSQRDQVAEMKAIADLTMRVIQGERAESIPTSTPNLDVMQVDWRQLQRWNISERRVPAETRIRFREPTIWDRYRLYVLGASAVVLAQMALIAALFVQRIWTRSAEALARASRDELRISYVHIRDLAGRLLAAQEAERARVARELHDDISQELALLIFDLDVLCGAAPGLHVDAAAVARSAAQRVHTLSKTIHVLSHQLHPARLQLVGLISALDSLRREITRPNLDISITCENVPANLPSAVSLCLFRVTQEALHNILKHSRARTVTLRLVGTPRSTALIVTDDGVGFDPENAVSQGVGLISMRERTEALGGEISVTSRPGHGTRIEVIVPRMVAHEGFYNDASPHVPPASTTITIGKRTTEGVS